MLAENKEIKTKFGRVFFKVNYLFLNVKLKTNKQTNKLHFWGDSVGRKKTYKNILDA